jgi:hypothetical protein
MTEREIDTAIDRAVRDLMDVDTDAAFRARVTARLHRPARRLLVPRLLAGALTAATVAAALVWIMRPSSSDAPPSAPRAGIASPTPAAPSQTPSAASDLPTPRPGPQPTTSASAPRAAATPIPRGTIVAATAEAAANRIDPLTAIDPIEVEPISQMSIVPSEIVVAPLTPISEMQISPLDPLTARD